MANRSLAGIVIARGASRQVDQRSEARKADLVASANVFFRGAPHHVKVLNISSRGTMVESDLVPRIGEPVLIQFENCSRIHAFVRWIRDGKLGLNFGHEIVLGD